MNIGDKHIHFVAPNLGGVLGVKVSAVNGQSKCAFGRVNAPEARLVCLKQGIAKGDSGVWRLRGRFWPSGAPKKGVKECGAA